MTLIHWLGFTRVGRHGSAMLKIESEPSVASTAWVPPPRLQVTAVSGDRDGSASANWFVGTSFLLRSAISEAGSSATVGTGRGSASGAVLAEDRGFVRLSIAGGQPRFPSASTRSAAARAVLNSKPENRFDSVFCWFRPASDLPERIARPGPAKRPNTIEIRPRAKSIGRRPIWTPVASDHDQGSHDSQFAARAKARARGLRQRPAGSSRQLPAHQTLAPEPAGDADTWCNQPSAARSADVPWRSGLPARHEPRLNHCGRHYPPKVAGEHLPIHIRDYPSTCPCLILPSLAIPADRPGGVPRFREISLAPWTTAIAPSPRDAPRSPPLPTRKSLPDLATPGSSGRRPA